jgi:hypothetical protein
VVTANCCLSNVDQSVHVSLKMCLHFLAPSVCVCVCVCVCVYIYTKIHLKRKWISRRSFHIYCPVSVNSVQNIYIMLLSEHLSFSGPNFACLPKWNKVYMHVSWKLCCGSKERLDKTCFHCVTHHILCSLLLKMELWINGRPPAFITNGRTDIVHPLPFFYSFVRALYLLWELSEIFQSHRPHSPNPRQILTSRSYISDLRRCCNKSQSSLSVENQSARLLLIEGLYRFTKCFIYFLLTPTLATQFST